MPLALAILACLGLAVLIIAAVILVASFVIAARPDDAPLLSLLDGSPILPPRAVSGANDTLDSHAGHRPAPVVVRSADRTRVVSLDLERARRRSHSGIGGAA